MVLCHCKHLLQQPGHDSPIAHYFLVLAKMIEVIGIQHLILRPSLLEKDLPSNVPSLCHLFPSRFTKTVKTVPKKIKLPITI